MARTLLELRRHARRYRAGREKQSMVPATLDVKGTKILAKSLFKELRGSGYSPNQILSLSTELIDLVTQDLKGDESVPVTGEPPRDWRAAL